jgi:hypothetical protein
MLLLWEQGQDEEIAKRAPPGIRCLPIFYSEDERHKLGRSLWTPHYDIGVLPPIDSPDVVGYPKRQQVIDPRDNLKKWSISYPVHMGNCLIAKKPLIDKLGQQKANEVCVSDMADEIQAALKFMVAINCANVVTTKHEAPVKLNAKRIKSGQSLLKDVHTIDLGYDYDTGARYRNSSVDQGGSHSSPIPHLRRGHIRRINSEEGVKSVWVRPAFVGANKAQTKEPAKAVYTLNPKML